MSRTAASTSAARQRQYRERKRDGVIRATAEIGPEACDLFVQLGYLAEPTDSTLPQSAQRSTSSCNAR